MKNASTETTNTINAGIYEEKSSGKEACPMGRDERWDGADDLNRIALPSGTWVPPDKSVYEDDEEEIYRRHPNTTYGGMRMPD